MNEGAARTEPVTREELFELAWKEPMLRLAERFGVSSSYMARVCTELRVPRPPRGYWAQLEFGKAPTRPALPAARPGDVTTWSPGSTLATSWPPARARASLVKPTTRRRKAPLVERHELLVGVKSFFLKSRKTEHGLLRPFKRMLVDIIASEEQLDAALDAANVLFLALEAQGHRVALAPVNTGLRRPQVDERETSRKHLISEESQQAGAVARRTGVRRRERRASDAGWSSC